MKEKEGSNAQNPRTKKGGNPLDLMKLKTSLTLLLAASVLCGCAAAPTTEGGLSKQEMSVITAAFGRAPTQNEIAVVTAVINAAKRNKTIVESATGRQMKDWTEADTKLWQDMNFRAFLQATAAEQEKAEARRRIAAAIGEGLQTGGRSIEEGAQQRAAAQQSGYGSGVILGPNGKTSTYFKNPGGGVILGPNGEITNVIGTGF